MDELGGGQNLRQSVVENQETNLDQPNGPQIAQLHGQHHFAAVYRPLGLERGEFGNILVGHVVAAVLGRYVDADHAARKQGLEGPRCRQHGLLSVGRVALTATTTIR